MKNVILFSLLLALLAACEIEPEDIVSTNKNDQTQATLVASFVKTYEGSIDHHYKVVMKITSDKGVLSGTYFYQSKGGNLTLKGTLNDKNEIVLDEFNDEGNQVGLFKGILEGSKMDGTWSKPDGSKEMVFELMESSADYEAIQEQVLSLNAVKGLIKSGVYLYSYKSSRAKLVIEKLDDQKCNFRMSVVSEFCDGDIEGTLEIDQKGNATFSTQRCETLFFSFQKNGISVKENKCDFHDAGCTFDGFYK